MVDMEDIVSLFLSTLNSESSPQVAEWKFAHVPIGSVISACLLYHTTRARATQSTRFPRQRVNQRD